MTLHRVAEGVKAFYVAFLQSIKERSGDPIGRLLIPPPN
jgi:hypothetical protein